MQSTDRLLAHSVCVLGTSFQWFGAHTGYHGFLNHLLPISVKIVPTSTSLSHRLLGRVARRALRAPELGSAEAFAAAELLIRLWRGGGIGHVLYGESHAAIVRRVSGLGFPVIATLHQPKSVHERRGFTGLGAARAVIALFRRDVEHYRGLIEGRQVYFIPHGVDCDFFRPGEGGAVERRILIVGHWLRDWEKIGAVLELVGREAPGVGTDVVASPHALDDPALAALVEQGRVTFCSGLSDPELLHRYQRSALMLCPFVDTGANNAIVEALACGLPIVTNDVGGIPDYGGGTVFEVARAGTAEELAALCLRYLNEPARRAEVARAEREFARRELDWPKIASRHLDVYEEVRRSLA